MPPFLGQLSLFPFDVEPSGWIRCDGRDVPIVQFDNLFFALGNTFGGDGQDFFALPNLEAVAPKGCHYCISYDGLPTSFDERAVGEILLTVVTENSLTPANLLECDGRSLSKNQFPMLSHLVGTLFGGDNTNFKLPDLRSKAPAKCRYVIATKGNDPAVPRDDLVFLGELMLLPFDVKSDRLRLCNGDLLPSQTTDACGVLGKKFGGDNQRCALPNLRKAGPLNFDYYINMRGRLPTPG